DLEDARSDRAFHLSDHQIEIVKGTKAREAHRPALGGIRIDVIEILEVWRIFELAELRHSVPPNSLLSLFLGRCLGGEQDRGGDQGGGRAGGEQGFDDQSSLLRSTRPPSGPERNRSEPLLCFSAATPQGGKASNGRWGSNSRAVRGKCADLLNPYCFAT